jgi:hypothetical protein
MVANCVSGKAAHHEGKALQLDIIVLQQKIRKLLDTGVVGHLAAVPKADIGDCF